MSINFERRNDNELVSLKVVWKLFVHNIQATFKPTNSLSFRSSKLKDRDPLLNQNNLVYKIDCLNCDGTYIGQTKQYLKSRIYEHEYSIRTKNSDCTMLAG